jgi:hypothetical protein
MDSITFESQRLRSLRAMQAGLLELKWLRDALRFDRALRQHLFVLKYGYNPAQLRDEIGRWVDTGAGGRVWVAGGGSSIGGGRGRSAIYPEPPTGNRYVSPKTWRVPRMLSRKFASTILTGDQRPITQQHCRAQWKALFASPRRGR